MKKALIIVDVQNDFLPPFGSLAVPNGDQIIPIINLLMDSFNLIVATKDWHPLHHCSFAIEHGKKPGDTTIVNGNRQELWPVHCVQETFGSEFSPSLKTEKIAKVFYKGIDESIDSYSAFFDNAHQRSTGLGEYLKSYGVKKIYIAGLATDYCVKYSAKDALQLGFDVSIIVDACKGIDLVPGDIQRALEEMQTLGAKLITSENLSSFL